MRECHALSFLFVARTSHIISIGGSFGSEMFQHICGQNASICLIDNLKKIGYTYLEGSCGRSLRKDVSGFPCGRPTVFFVFHQSSTYRMGNINVVNVNSSGGMFLNRDYGYNISITAFQQAGYLLFFVIVFFNVYSLYLAAARCEAGETPAPLFIRPKHFSNTLSKYLQLTFLLINPHLLID